LAHGTNDANPRERRADNVRTWGAGVLRPYMSCVWAQAKGYVTAVAADLEAR
jgi:hypothetical protein